MIEENNYNQQDKIPKPYKFPPSDFVKKTTLFPEGDLWIGMILISIIGFALILGFFAS